MGEAWDFPYPPKALHTYLRPFTFISGPPHTLKDLHIHLTPYIPILDHHTFRWRFTPTSDPLYPTQTFHTNPRPFRSVQVSPPTHPRPFIPMLIHSHTSDALHIHQSLQYLSQALHLSLKLHTPISGTPHPTKAFQTHIRPSLALYIHPQPSTHVPGSPHTPQTPYTHSRPSIPP